MIAFVSLFSELRNRRVLQITLVYLGAVFAAFEFTDIAVERYGLSDRLVDMVLTGMLTMLPTVMMIAWFHGKPGKDEWNRVEKIGIPLNLIVAIVLAVTVVPQRPAQATSEVRTAATTDGEKFVVEVPRSDLLRNAAVFFFEPDGLDDASVWQAYAIPHVMAVTLNRDPYIDAGGFYDYYGMGNLFWRVQRAGYQNGLGVPVTLLRTIADDFNKTYFITGTLSQADDQLAATIEIYQVSPLQRLAVETVQGADIYTIAERASDTARKALRPERVDADTIEYVPVRETLSGNPVAVEAFVRGRNSWMIERDSDAAIAGLLEAVDIDRDFALAWVSLSQLYFDQGRATEALEAIRETNRLSYRLDDVTRIYLKAQSYAMRNEPEKAMEVYEMWVDLEPENPVARNALATNYTWFENRLEDAIVHYEKSLELLPTQTWIYGRLADAHRVLGDQKRAVELYEIYAEIQPNDYTPLVTIGDILTKEGRHDEAARYYRQGNLTQPEMVTPVVRMAENAARVGRYEDAFSTLDEADMVAQAPNQVAVVEGLRRRLHMLLGRPSQALQALEQEIANVAQSKSTLDTAFAHLRNIHIYAESGETQKGWAVVDALTEEFDPPFEFVPSIGAVALAIYDGNLELARDQLSILSTAISQMARDDLNYLTNMIEGLIEQQEGNPLRAAELLKSARELLSRSSQLTQEDARSDLEFIDLALAKALLDSGDAENALGVVSEILLNWPGHPEANFIAARAYRAAGNMTAMNEHLVVALRHWEDSEEIFMPAQQARELAASIDLAQQ